MATDISDVSICNLALVQLGADTINSLENPQTANAKKCNAIYERVRDDLLTSCIWNFAQKRASLSQLSGEPEFTDDLMTIKYQKPADYLKLNFTNVPFARVKIEGDQILSDTANLKIKYTFRATDPTKYFPSFITALGARLAAELAYSITASRTIAVDLWALYRDIKLPAAQEDDGQQGTPQQPLQDMVNATRLIGSSLLVGRTGDSTWYPLEVF